jgi:hypothetical protein
MSELLDIDLDSIVFDSTIEPIALPQIICDSTFNVINKIIEFKKGPRWFMDEHMWSLMIWQIMGIRQARVWHLDPHHDFYGSTNSNVWNGHLSRNISSKLIINSATYLLAAWRFGIVNEVIWVIPKWLSKDKAKKDLEREMGKGLKFITIEQLEYDQIPLDFNIITIAWSRKCINLTLHDSIVSSIPVHVVKKIKQGENIIEF